MIILSAEDKHYYRLFDHTADLGMEIFGEDAPSLFVNAGRALFHVMVSVGQREGRKTHPQQLSVEGYDRPDLMVNWLRELLYLWHGRQRIPVQIHIGTLTETHIVATITTCSFLSSADVVQKEVKAVTYHQITAAPQADGRWRARVVFDV